jgi:LacI family transcriptional regulator
MSMPDPRPTLATLAAAAGVSRMTVSRALRNAPEIAPERREQILALAHELGYRPDPKMTAFMHYLRERRGRSRGETLAYVFCHSGTGEPTRSQSQERFFTGIQRRTRQLGYGLDAFVVGPAHLGIKRLTRVLEARGIRGSLLASAWALGEALDPLIRSTVCCVAGTHLPELRVHRATSAHYASLRIALDHLHAAGQRRIGLYIGHGTDAHLLHAWRAGLADFLLQHGENPAQLLHLVAAWDQDDFTTWVRATRPTTILTLHRPAREWLHAAGLASATRIALLDRAPEDHEFPGIDQNTEAIGAAAVDLVAARLLANDIGAPPYPHVISVNGTWIDLPSTA